MTKFTGKIKHLNNLMQTKQISCEELTNKYIESIEKENEVLNAYIYKTYDLAMQTAKNVDEKIKRGEKLHPLEGIPMTLKDNISTKGIRTTGCSKMLKNYVPIYNATVWDILKNKNAVMLGKTNMDEFAMGSSCRTSCFKGTTNPHNTNCVAGGSSGGVASAVSGNIAVYGLGSDTGGSIREPAAFCGIVGLKPTYGTISRYGIFSLASSLDQLGPMTTSVEDAAIVYDTISKYDPKDSTSYKENNKLTYNTLNNDIKGLKIGVSNDHLNFVKPEIRESIEKVIKVYEDLGAEIVYFDLPVINYSLPVYYVLACAEAASNFARYDGIRYGYCTNSYKDINEMMSKTRGEGFGEEVKRRMLFGTYVLSKENYDKYYKKAQKLRMSIIKAIDKAFECCDVMLTPTAPKTSFELDYFPTDPIDIYMSDICTVPFSIAGLPAISVPCGFASNNLPLGMQLVGKRFDEATILNVGYKYEVETRSTSFRDSGIGVRL